MTFWYWDRLCVLCWRDCSTIDCGSDVLQKFYCSEPNIHDVCLSGSPVEVHSTFPLTWIIGCGDRLKPGLSSEELSLGAPVWCWGNNMGYAQFGCLSQHSITVLCPSAPLKSVPFKNQRLLGGGGCVTYSVISTVQKHTTATLLLLFFCYMCHRLLGSSTAACDLSTFVALSEYWDTKLIRG